MKQFQSTVKPLPRYSLSEIIVLAACHILPLTLIHSYANKTLYTYRWLKSSVLFYTQYSCQTLVEGPVKEIFVKDVRAQNVPTFRFFLNLPRRKVMI